MIYISTKAHESQSQNKYQNKKIKLNQNKSRKQMVVEIIKKKKSI